MQDFEKLGLFYLGREYDLERQQLRDDLVLYDSSDLTTHGLCVGMTGSGKTGLSISLLEEAAIDGVPAIVVDPKGDLGNLMLTFPELRPEDFRPWIDESAAARKGLTPEAAATETAETWRKGLADWGQDGARIARLRESAQATLYTPGSTAGRPISVLRSLQAPADMADMELVRDRIQSVVSGLLALLGIEADSVRSREHILLSTIIETAWLGGRNLGLAELIADIQTPPFSTIGVMDLESVYPEKDRMALAVQLNNLLASPGFSAWLEGDPLDAGQLLYTPEGRPRISILSIAHLSDVERMFFVTLLLNEVLAWMRQQPGTPSLRALLYMDEIYGYFPPTAMPPCKRPMLTLLKQARAYGLGILLATQNPVDLDYKGLANTGTWLIGRLQTERDKARVLDGLEGAATTAGSQFDRSRMDAVLSGLSNRVFLMHNVHEDAPVVFQTRWALSYLSGPLTREQIRRLTPQAAVAPLPAVQAPAAAAPQAPRALTTPTPALAQTVPETVAPVEPVSQVAPQVVLPTIAAAQPAAQMAIGPEISLPQSYLPVTLQPPAGAKVTYSPILLACAEIRYVRVTPAVDYSLERAWIAELPEPGRQISWEGALVVQESSLPLESEPAPLPAQFAALSEGALSARRLEEYRKGLTSFVYNDMPLRLWKCADPKGVSDPEETEVQFRMRLGQAARERRDQAMAQVRAKYADRLASLQERLRQAQERIAREQAEHSSQNLDAVVSLGATVLGGLFGRKVVSRQTMDRAASTLRRATRASRGGREVTEAEDSLEQLQTRQAELEAEFNADLQAVNRAVDGTQLALEAVDLRAKRSDIQVTSLALLWAPWAIDASGQATPLFELPAAAQRATGPA
ncbi:MAG: DUF87 domain-containing protein [Armatimonadia bacterium]